MVGGGARQFREGLSLPVSSHHDVSLDLLESAEVRGEEVTHYMSTHRGILSNMLFEYLSDYSLLHAATPTINNRRT